MRLSGPAIYWPEDAKDKGVLIRGVVAKNLTSMQNISARPLSTIHRAYLQSAIGPRRSRSADTSRIRPSQ
jgi:hypothetical protein